MQTSSTDHFNAPHDLCIKDYSSKYSVKKTENESRTDFNGSTSSLDDDTERQSPEPNQQTSTGDRLMQLIVKGILYENCVNYCEQLATSNSFNFNHQSKRPTDDVEPNSNKLANLVDFSSLLNGDDGKTDLKLLNWLTSLPKESFNFYFDSSHPLNLRIDPFEKPTLVANWSETILATPIKPKVFPHFATPFTKMSSVNGSTNLSSSTNQSHSTQLSLNNQTQLNNPQLAGLLSSLGGTAGANIGNLLNLVNQMSGFQSLFIDDLANNKSALNTDRLTAEPNENGSPKLDFLAQNFSQLTSINDRSNVNSNLFNLTNGNSLTNSNLNGNHNSNSSSDLVSSLNNHNLASLLQTSNLQSLLNGNTSLNDLNQALNGQTDDSALLDRSTSLLINNQKLSAKVQKDYWKKMHHIQKKKIIDDHLVVCNNGSTKLNHTFVTNQTGLFGDDDLCKSGKRTKQYKKRDNSVSALF